MKYDGIEFYTKDEVRDILGIGRDKANSLFKSRSFPSVNIGNTKIILKKNFEDWLEKNSGREVYL